MGLAAWVSVHSRASEERAGVLSALLTVALLLRAYYVLLAHVMDCG